MPEFTLPDGIYISISGVVRARFGGQTRAVLLRNRYFTQYAGVGTTLITLDQQPVYPLERERLTERGELVPGMRLLNIFESYRDENLVTGPPIADALPDLGHMETTETRHPDGTIHYTAYREPETETDLVRDYRRADGSVYVRTPGPDVVKHQVPIMLADRQNRVVHSWPTRVGWTHHWLLALAGDAERVIVIADSRPSMGMAMPMPDKRFHGLLLFHNVHLGGQRHWNDEFQHTYVWSLSNVAKFDGLVTLTARQRADIQQRVGARNNLFTVSNPVTVPPVPEARPDREPATFRIVSRFETQKRLDHAVQAFALVVAERPQARLEIYGRGALRQSVERLIIDLGLTENITLMGWNPDARETLWTATGFLMSSGFEGYPLATLESLSRGCPVVSYDVKYGPREQITDGVDGFLVPDRDQRAMADRVIQMIDDPALVRRMSDAALIKANQHDYRAFMTAWSDILAKVVANKPKRVTLGQVNLEVTRLGYRPTPLPRRIVDRVRPRRLVDRVLPIRSGSVSLSGSREIVFEGVVRVAGRFPGGALKRARFSLSALSSTTETVTMLPLTVKQEGREFRLSSRFPVAQTFVGRSPDDNAVRLRLRLVVRNAGWETLLTRPVADQPEYEIVFDQDDAVVLKHGQQQ